MLALEVARNAPGKRKPGGSLVFMGGTGGRRPGPGMTIMTTVTIALPALIAGLALELAPIRVNLIAAGFVDTPLSASLLGDQLDGAATSCAPPCPSGASWGPDDVAALAVHLMSNTALTGATYDIDGGQQLVAAREERTHPCDPTSRPAPRSRTMSCPITRTCRAGSASCRARTP